MPTDLKATLEMLTGQPSTEHPYLSVYLDWTPDGNGNRQSLGTLEDELNNIATRLQERGADLESFNTDRQRITEYLADEAPADARGIAIFACDAESIWEAIPLQVPVETRIVEDRFPHCFSLARIIDDYETYALVLADSQESRILVVSLNQAEQAAQTQAAEDIKRFEAGGWAQMIFQRRTENVVKAHTKDIGDRLGRLIKRYDIQHVIIAGNDTFKGVILNTLPDQIKDKLVDYINLDITANMEAIMDVIEPMMRQVELDQEVDVVTRLEGQVGAQSLGVAGVAETAMALTKGQVDTLIMHQGFLATGGECPNCGTIRAGLRNKCPYDGAEMQQIDLREAFTARALQQGSDIQIVEESEFLDQHEGVGALLRYRDTPQAQTV
jgi:peptide subunit release factor 1 (eRF1)